MSVILNSKTHYALRNIETHVMVFDFIVLGKPKLEM